MASLLVIAVTAMLIGLGTFAHFNDTETSTGNTFTAGTLDIRVNGVDDPAVWKYTSPTGGLKPNDSGEYTFVIQNVGSLPGLLTIKVGPYSEAAGAYPEPEKELQDSDVADLDDELYILLWQDDGDNIYEPYPAPENEVPLLAGKVSAVLSQAGAVTILPNYVLGSQAIKYLGFHWKVQDVADINKIMGDSVVFNIEFSIVQQ